MFLIISTTKRYDFKLGISNNGDLHLFDFETKNQSSDLLPAINGFLTNNKIKLTDLEGILVNIGPGSYTGIRVGVTIANTLAWSLNIPVLGYSDDGFKKVLSKLKPGQNFSGSVLPLYKK